MSLKDFTILTKLGEGAYSIVYKVQRKANRCIYALKKVKLANLSQKQIENALNQVRILASIKNPYIVAYKQVFLQGKSLCIVMQFLDDRDLYQKIVQHKKKNLLFQQSQIWRVFIQIVRALNALHGLNIHHRDLKSANVFLNKSGESKLGDMNVSKISKNGMLYTQTGTPYYASPEVWRDQSYDNKSDIWSLGCVIYEMATLQPPFKAQDMEGLYNSVTKGVFKPISEKYSKQLSHIIKLMLQQKPKARPSTDKILNSSLIKKKVQQISFLSIADTNQEKVEMLKTIRLPSNLSHLTERLPKPNYDSQNKQTRSPNSLINSPKHQQGNMLTSKQNLPKLNQILKKSFQQKRFMNKKRKKNNKNSLMIEGTSKIIEEARGYQKKSKNIEKEIREELKKIYKAKDLTKSQEYNKSQKSQILPPITKL